MLQRLQIFLAQVKAKFYWTKSDKLYILCIKKKKLLKSIQQYNEFNEVIKQNGYYIYEFEK